MNNLLSNTGLERPKCEYKGALPHPAKPAYLLLWFLQSGVVAKWSCAGHRFSFGGNRGYFVTKVECFEDNKPPRSHELAAVLEVPEEARLREITQEEERAVFGEFKEQSPTCIDPECGRPARPGRFCDECYGAWEEEQRAKAAAAAAEGRPYAINKRRGF